MPQSSDPTVRRSTRLFQAVHEFHKQGYQNLAVYCRKSRNGSHWQCTLTTFNNLVITKGSVEVVDDITFEQLNHSAEGSGNQYFGWTDATQDSTRQLANRIKARPPYLLKHAEGDNFTYAGWFTHMLGHAEASTLPVIIEYPRWPVWTNATLKTQIPKLKVLRLKCNFAILYLRANGMNFLLTVYVLTVYVKSKH